MAGPGRDVIGVILIEQRLGRLREELMEADIAGNPVASGAVSEQEKAAIDGVWTELNEPAPKALFGPGPVGPSGDGGKLGQELVLLAHRALLAIPAVGDPRFSEGP